MFKRSAPLDKRAPTNAYQAFALERRPLLPKDMCCGEREKFIGQLWKALPKTEKDKWKAESNAYTRPVPYYAFCKEQRPLLPPTLQNKERDTALGQMWRALPPTERAKYEVDGSRAPPVPSFELSAPPAPPALTLPASQSHSPPSTRLLIERHNWVEKLLREHEVGVSMDLDTSIEMIESITWSPSPLTGTGVDELNCSIDSSSSFISLDELAQLAGEAMEVLAEQSREQGQS